MIIALRASTASRWELLASYRRLMLPRQEEPWSCWTAENSRSVCFLVSPLLSSHTTIHSVGLLIRSWPKRLSTKTASRLRRTAQCFAHEGDNQCSFLGRDVHCLLIQLCWILRSTRAYEFCCPNTWLCWGVPTHSIACECVSTVFTRFVNTCLLQHGSCIFLATASVKRMEMIKPFKKYKLIAKIWRIGRLDQLLVSNLFKAGNYYIHKALSSNSWSSPMNAWTEFAMSGLCRRSPIADSEKTLTDTTANECWRNFLSKDIHFTMVYQIIGGIDQNKAANRPLHQEQDIWDTIIFALTHFQWLSSTKTFIRNRNG